MELWRANVIAACRTVLESNVYNEEDDGQEAADARRRASESIKYIFWTLIEEITDEANHGRSPDDDIE